MREEYEIFFMYFLACQRITDASEEMYESLFTEDGEPIYDIDKVNEIIKDFQKNYRVEIDLIRQTAIEYQETRTDEE